VRQKAGKGVIPPFSDGDEVLQAELTGGYQEAKLLQIFFIKHVAATRLD